MDKLPSAEREQRDEFWSAAINRYQGAPGAIHGVGSGSSSTDTPEFPTISNGLWVIGTVEAYSVHSPDLNDVVYTEIFLRVKQTFPASTATRPPDDGLIAVELRGGTLKQQGLVRSVDLMPQRYALQPPHTYLLLLLYQPKGNFYLEGKPWDVSDGTIKPDEIGEVARWHLGKSLLAGQTLSVLPSYLDHQFSPDGS